MGLKNYCILLFIIAINLVNTSKVASNEKPSRFLAEAIIQQIVKMLRTLIKNGSTENDIPVMDPYSFDSKKLNYTGQLFSINANISGGVFEGLAGFEIIKQAFNKTDISLDIDINFPSLRLHSEYYEMVGDIIQAIPLIGNGKLDISMKDLRFWGKTYLKQSSDGKSILIDRFQDPQISVRKVLSKTEFDNNIDDIFNALIQDVAAEYITRFGKALAAQYIEEIINIINPILNKFESWRLIVTILPTTIRSYG